MKKAPCARTPVLAIMQSSILAKAGASRYLRGMKQSEARYVDVLLPLALSGPLTYRVPAAMAIVEGARVVVPLRQSSRYVGVAWRLHDEAPRADIKVREVETVLDDTPLITPLQRRLWEWMARYYMCTLGEVYKCAMPAGLKLERESVVRLLTPPPCDLPPLSEGQRKTLFLVERDGEIGLEQLLQELGEGEGMRWLKQLLRLRVLAVEDRMVERYKPRREVYVFLEEAYVDEANFVALLAGLKRAPAQERVMTSFLQLLQAGGLAMHAGVPRAQLLAASKASATVLQALEQKQIVRLEAVSVSRIAGCNLKIMPLPGLSEAQRQGLEAMERVMARGQAVLLHGVTGSGKTEIYIRLLAQCVAKGQSALYLLPEIALTAQLALRLRRVFGDRVGLYHSRQPDEERRELYENLLGLRTAVDSPDVQIVLGARSALFLPYRNLGLIIVDEEHESSYKQHSPTPRYQGRDVALYMAQLHGCKIVLGSATPSLESYSNAQSGRFGLVELTQRYGDAVLPAVEIIDVREAQHRREMQGHFSQQLFEAVEDALTLGNQVILFQNRRGYAPYLQCDDCGWVPTCNHCDVSLTYHKDAETMVCHYCAERQPLFTVCGACGSKHMVMRGLGTQRVEEELQALIPQARIARLDLDSTRGNAGAERIINLFTDGKIDVLIGTQMVTKGLDFKRVQVVGILDADSMLRMPDFRASERAYQLMAQVGGRAGRHQEPGRVLIQAIDVHSPVLEWVKENNYSAFYQAQIRERCEHSFPPYVRLVRVTLRHKDAPLLQQAADAFGEVLRRRFGHGVLGPQRPLVSRVKEYFLMELLVKLQRSVTGMEDRDYILACIDSAHRVEAYRQVLFTVDADPA